MSTELQTTDVIFEDALSERYLSYALSTIMSRSLPDVRDGLKPVHRRLIYAMHQLHLNPNSSFKKCARVVGDVMGKFHPHGDGAIYNALVRLAQDFSVRYPLIDGQGNFGNVDGDSAAAMRYTEARLTELSIHLLDHLEAVPFQPTYDGEESEPFVLPAAFPNILANGATGIAVGMATSVPPHNLDELCQALVHLIQKPNATVQDLMKWIQGPDFPTGGILVDSDDVIARAYETGKGSFRLRARWITEPVPNKAPRLVVTEIPYMVEKARLIEKLADLFHEKKLPFIEDFADESTEHVRIVFHLKSRNIDPATAMENLFRLSDLETRIPVNMNVLDAKRVPRVMPLPEMLQAFLDHRRHVLTESRKVRLNAIEARLSLLTGYIIVYLNLDEVITIIRDHDDPHARLMERFELESHQVDAILNMRLRSLRKLQEIELRKEQSELLAEKADIELWLIEPEKQWKSVAEGLKDIRKRYGITTELGRRRTSRENAPDIVIEPDAWVEKEDVTVVISQKGWVRVVKNLGDLKYKEGDGEGYVIATSTTEKLLVMSQKGRVYTLSVDKLPRTRGTGEALRLMIDMPPEDEVATITVLQQTTYLVLTSDGRGFRVEAEDLVGQTRLGRQVVNTQDNARVVALLAVTLPHLALVANNRKMLIVPVEQIPVMSRGRGVIVHRYHDAELTDWQWVKIEDGLIFQKTSTPVRVKDVAPWIGPRGGSGRLVPPGFPLNHRFKS